MHVDKKEVSQRKKEKDSERERCRVRLCPKKSWLDDNITRA
jgi:hypothetical protein